MLIPKLRGKLKSTSRPHFGGGRAGIRTRLITDSCEEVQLARGRIHDAETLNAASNKVIQKCRLNHPLKSQPTMKPHLFSLVFGIAASLMLTQCDAPVQVARANAARPAILSGSDVTVTTIGDTSVATKRLINRPLTNKDIGKVYEVVTYASPHGSKVEDRIIVRTTPKLQTKVVSR